MSDYETVCQSMTAVVRTYTHLPRSPSSSPFFVIHDCFRGDLKIRKLNRSTSLKLYIYFYELFDVNNNSQQRKLLALSANVNNILSLPFIDTRWIAMQLYGYDYVCGIFRYYLLMV